MSGSIGSLSPQGLGEGAQAEFVAAGGRTLPPVHPGEVLLEEFLKPLGLGTTRTAHRLGVPRTRVERLVRCEMGVTPDTALRLERLLGASAAFWLNLQTAYDLAIARDRADPSIADIRPVAEGTTP